MPCLVVFCFICLYLWFFFVCLFSVSCCAVRCAPCCVICCVWCSVNDWLCCAFLHALLSTHVHALLTIQKIYFHHGLCLTVPSTVIVKAEVARQARANSSDPVSSDLRDPRRTPSRGNPVPRTRWALLTLKCRLWSRNSVYNRQRK